MPDVYLLHDDWLLMDLLHDNWSCGSPRAAHVGHILVSPLRRGVPGSGACACVLAGSAPYSLVSARGCAGPCIGLDTACSSSLVATHLAHKGLLDGETSAALASGVNLMLVASTSTHLAQLGALSPNGRSKSFDASGDGYGRGEACISAVLRLPGEPGSHAAMAILLGASPTLLLAAQLQSAAVRASATLDNMPSHCL